MIGVPNRRRTRNLVNFLTSALVFGIITRTSIMILVDISSFLTIYFPRFFMTGALVMSAAVLSFSRAGAVLAEVLLRRHAKTP